MVEKVVDVRTIVVTNEVEALILEANLIKRHQPPFNVRLRDDKRYPYLKVTERAVSARRLHALRAQTTARATSDRTRTRTACAS